MGNADAASTNITVTNNNQISTIDQGTPQIVRTSTVTVKDATATLGYTLLAKISTTNGTTPIPGATVTIYPTIAPTAPSTSPCTQTTPCTLPYDNGTGTLSPLEILTVPEPTATQSAGHTSQWTVTISLPQNTPQGNYILDIAYSEDSILPPPTLLDMTYMQDLSLPENAQVCANTSDRTRVILIDRRNNQPYYVEKIGALCWMETNLRYWGDGDWNSAWNYPDDRYATIISNITANPNDDARPLTTAPYYQAGSYTAAQRADTGGSTTLDITAPTNNTTFYGYLYNWCAAMGGQANACNNTTDAPQSNFDTAQSICPAGWRLPTGYSTGEFQIMADAIGATNNSIGSANFRNNFLAVYSGYYYNGSLLDGGITGSGNYWTSNVGSAVSAFYYGFSSASVGSGGNYKNIGYAIRCVL